ncbi:hypothetical protein [Sinanaerobacter sp. ZZT-01]|uniref:hypothetical protein n=1 Tax=Sinanaerobacter sp. ZZT-01 TaxID=3111540 RepID=UPI002D7731E8|nr:hypothetical protein [Sinanaerobacter sp. ZZT-01]WRR93018.1 hypothetical protein U5921_13405 [Sinanaerobacter sp. ZZT-01]
MDPIDSVFDEDLCVSINLDTIPEVTKTIESIDDPLKKDLIVKYLFTPTNIETEITSSEPISFSSFSNTEFNNCVMEQNAEEASFLLDKIGVLLDIPVDELEMEVASIELKGEKVMKEILNPLNDEEVNKIKKFSELKSAANSYEATFRKKAKSGYLTILEFEVEMDWQSNNNKITYCDTNSFSYSYVWYWVHYATTTQDPVVKESYATLTGKKATFREINRNGYYGAGYYYMIMPTLRLNVDGSYSPTSVPSVSI